VECVSVATARNHRISTVFKTSICRVTRHDKVLNPLFLWNVEVLGHSGTRAPSSLLNYQLSLGKFRIHPAKG